MSKTGVIVVSDLHINSTTGLCPPTVNLDDGGTYRSSREQRALYDSWIDFWDTAKKLTADCTSTVAILNGDLVDADTKKRSTQLISRNPADINRMSGDVLDVIETDKIVVVRGTEAHAGKSAHYEETIANDRTNIVGASKDIKSFWIFQANINGRLFDVSHHWAMGGLPWTEANAANKLAYLTVNNYRSQGEKIPDFVIRAHNHRYADSGGNFDTFAILLPCWTLLSAYGHRIGASQRPSQIGGVVLAVEGRSDYLYKLIRYKVKAKKLWTIKI